MDKRISVVLHKKNVSAPFVLQYLSFHCSLHFSENNCLLSRHFVGVKFPFVNYNSAYFSTLSFQSFSNLKKNHPLLLAMLLLYKGPFTHAIFDVISRTKRALPIQHGCYFSRSIAWIGKKVTVITYYLKTLYFPTSANLAVFFSQRCATKNLCGVGWARFYTA